ncbi:MAG TPA: hypothetical protein VI278_08365 [Nitrososphaeraceae archaeon]
MIITKTCTAVDVTHCLGPPPLEFPITATGNNLVRPSSFSLSIGESQTVTLGPGSFTIHESVPGEFFNPVWEGNCVQSGGSPASGSPDATVTISAGQTLHCTILNRPAPI